MAKEAIFFLDKPKSEGLTHIFIQFSCRDGVMKCSIQQKIHPNDWNFDAQMAKKDRAINAEILRINSVVEQYQESCRIMMKPVLKDGLRSEINLALGKKERKRVVEFYEAIDILTDEARSGKILTPTGTKYTEATLKKWVYAKEILYEFNPKLTFELISLDTYGSFVKFCNEKNFSANYTGNIVKCWKRFMTLAAEKKWHQNNIHNDPNFKKLKFDSEQVYLNEEEIDAIYNLDLSKTPHTEQLRDRYIINLFNGLRVSDMTTLNMNNIVDGKIYHNNQKTGKKVVIPLHPYVKAIIDKYGGKLPKQFHEVTINREIKLICKLAGINDTVRFIKIVGGVKKEFVKKKWELITNHTARRAMATNLLKYASTIDAMPVLGMSLRTLEKYNKRSAEENANMLMENPFFN